MMLPSHIMVSQQPVHLALAAALIGGTDPESGQMHTADATVRVQMSFQVTL